jgi:L-threonylcarbamoyladenylate synthase
MLIIDYKKKHHKKIIDACVLALRKGKTVAYPTDTSYGLAADACNIKAVKKLFQIKKRGFNKPVHIVVPSAPYAKKIARWNPVAEKLSHTFWPGALTLILPLVGEGLKPSPTMKKLSANTGTIGLRMPKNQIAMDLAKFLGRPITATSANLSGQIDCYSVGDIIAQFKNQTYKPDIIINAGKLPKRKPSTMVRIVNGEIKILRRGPISEKQIKSLLNTKLKFSISYV